MGAHMRNIMRFAVIFCCLQVVVCWPASAQIYEMRDVNTTDMSGLDRQKTVIIIPGGILEEHGPYLPSYTDGYKNEYVTRRIAEAIVARPGWSVLLFPQIPLGDGGGNQIAKRQVFPGTYHLHFSTLRAVYMDLASEFGEAGFRKIFVISDHGAPQHQLALDQAEDFFNETYGGTMVCLSGLIEASRLQPQLGLTNEEDRENGLDVHGGMDETSQMLFLHPELVRPGYRTAPPQAGSNWRELINRGAASSWPGYFG